MNYSLEMLPKTKYMQQSMYILTLDCILSPSLMNSVLPLPALVRPFTSSVDAPDPIPNVNTLT